MSIHPQAGNFGAVVTDYEKGRPGYPGPAVSWLLEQCQVAGATRVLDLAAGTGKFTSALIGQGPNVVAVEPVEGMRQRLRERVPGAEVLDGTAERIPLGDASVEVVTAAQAFHWFDHAKALPEIHRVLAPGGRLGIIFNVRQPLDEVEIALDRLWDRYRQDVPTHRDARWQEAFAESGLFDPLTHRAFEMEQVLGPEELVARVTSTSFIASLEPGELASVVDEVRGLCERYGAPVHLHYHTDCYWTERQ